MCCIYISEKFEKNQDYKATLDSTKKQILETAQRSNALKGVTMVDIEDYKATLETSQRNNSLKGMGHHGIY
jgi:hypothetical protein